MTDNEKLELILAEMQNVTIKIQGVEQQVAEVKQQVAEVKQEVTKTNLTIENEIRVNIQRVAEGHLDLSRKLNECIKLSEDIRDKQELQDIYINMHNNKLKAL